MKKYLATIIFCAITNISWTYAAQFNGNIYNYTNNNIYLCGLGVQTGNWHGPQVGGILEPVPPSTPAGYSQTSSVGTIETYITLTNSADCNNASSWCKFELHYSSIGGYDSHITSHGGTFTCQINEVNNCDSCLDFVVSSSSAKNKNMKPQN